MVGKFVKYSILVAIIVVVGWLFATGRFSAKDAEQAGRRAYYQGRGVVDKLAESPRSGNHAEAAQCRENLRLIESAKRKAASTKGQVVGALTVQEVEAAFKGPVPTCPSGGHYTYGPIVALPTCSMSSGGNLDNDDDHVLLNY